MNENLNLRELLKDCPKGTAFYSTVYGDVNFQCVSADINDVYCINFIRSEGSLATVAADGKHIVGFEGECTFFPSKEQRDWSKWHRPFKDGDIVFYDNCVGIFKEWGDETLFRNYVKADIDGRHPMLCDKPNSFGKDIRRESRFATEEEKQRLFEAIESRGFKWNSETKSLEKVGTETFKNGDIIVSTFGNIAIFSHTKNDGGRDLVFYHCLYSHGSVSKFKACVSCGIGYVEDCRLATEHEKDLMMDALIKNGYRWNKITKTVEKINHKSCLNCKTHYSMHQNCPYSPVYRFIDLNDAYLHMNDDANCEFWTNNNLVRKFGIGEKVVEIASGEVYEVADITDKGYFLSHYNLTTFSYQYKLVKFEEEDEFDTIMYFTKSTCNDRKTEINVRCECTSSVSDVEDSDDVPGFFL